MKKIFGILGIGALLSFASCSNDMPSDGKVSEDQTHSYVNILIASPGVNGTRADGDGDGKYAYGTDAENEITSFLLLFYDNQGNLVGKSDGPAFTDVTKNETSNNVAVIKQGTAKVTLTEGANLPSQLIVLINADETTISEALTSNLDDMLDELTISVGTNNLWTNNKFQMNNSGYFPEGNDYMVVPVNIDERMLYSSEEAAAQALAAGTNIVKVYVERLAVKGSLSFAEDATYQLGNSVVDPDGKAYDLTFTVTKYDVTATAPTSYYIKHNRSLTDISGTTNSNAEFVLWMNAYNDFRSYWCQSYFAAIDESTYPVVGDKEDYSLNYKSTNDINNNGWAPGKTVYFAENTARASQLSALDDNPWTAATAYLINGKYTVAAAEENGGDPSKYTRDFYLKATQDLTSGETIYQIFTAAEALASLDYEYINIATNEEGEFEQSKLAAYLELTHLDYYFDAAGTKQENNPANRMTVQLIEGVDLSDLYSYNEENGVWEKTTMDVDQINEALAKVGRTFMMYNGGEAYFYVPIKHYTGNMETAQAQANFPDLTKLHTGNIGVVRNHVYNMIVDKITGLGIGVGPDKDIPELPDPTPVQNYYINARLNVLQWHIMGQHVSL
ncbi:MAG: Mfa1 family fimbria major subunit [Muribaculaceae bacterium]|nr:Mfa1 family fimbria major subunit [Muribaculaceae bacterium]